MIYASKILKLFIYDKVVSNLSLGRILILSILLISDMLKSGEV